METIKKEGDYSIVKMDNWYQVYHKSQALKTPIDNVVRTLYLPIAEQLLKDWKEQGYESFTDPYSLLCYHFTMVDHFSRMSHEQVVNVLNSLNWEKCWSFRGCPSPNPHFMMEWMGYMGVMSKKVDLIREWFHNQTIMQLVASTCVYNAFMDFNVAYYMAVVVEAIPEKEHKEAIMGFHHFYSKYSPTYSDKEFWAIFERFSLYYGIHFKEDGPHLPILESK